MDRSTEIQFPFHYHHGFQEGIKWVVKLFLYDNQKIVYNISSSTQNSFS